METPYLWMVLFNPAAGNYIGWNLGIPVILNSLLSQMRTTVLEYLPTKLGDFVRANVGKYSSTMEHMAMENGPSRKFVDFPSYKMVMFSLMFFACLVWLTELKDGDNFHPFIVDLPNLKMVIFKFANCEFTRGIDPPIYWVWQASLVPRPPSAFWKRPGGHPGPAGKTPTIHHGFYY